MFSASTHMISYMHALNAALEGGGDDELNISYQTQTKCIRIYKTLKFKPYIVFFMTLYTYR